MDYFDTLNSPKEAELAYAKWYEQLPIERKAKMICDFYQFPMDKVSYDTKKENPFVNESDIKLLFIQHTQKEKYLPETFAFIQQKMKERSEKEWQNRFKAMKKTLGWSYEEMARYIGASNGASVKASINRKLPAFAKLAVCVFEQMQKNQADTNQKTNSDPEETPQINK